VVHEHAIAFLELPASGAHRDDLARGFMTGDNPLVCLRSDARVFTIDRADITSAYARGAHAYHHLLRPRIGRIQLPYLDPSISG
jgi:hypothetical protein